jgi:hypothetical protein
MRGNPLSRATSPDGRWAYTLYDGAAGAPFIHALDTIGRTAHCIDLDALAGSLYLSRLRLRLDGGALSIRDGGEAELIVDTNTFVVRKPAKPSARSASRHGSRSSWQLVGWAAFGTLVASGSLLLARRRHRRPAFGR